VAFYDREQEWIEMRLRALRPQVVEIRKLGITVHFANREELRTEISAKFTRERLEADLAAAGLRLAEFMTDPDDLFALSVAAPAPR
jgi:L-histidine N-alpha-methyltransferase